MVFSSTIFLFLFLPLVLILYYNPFWKNRELKNTILLITSLGFYAWGEPLFALVMLFSIFLNWFLVLRMEKSGSKKKRKILLGAAVVFDIGLIFIFKYLSFTLSNAAAVFGTKAPAVNIALPIGISFFTFQIMSYVFDVYYEKTPVQKNFFHLALYVSMFPQLIAGPIVRYETVAEEIENRKESSKDFTDGMVRFVFGLAKKVLIANYVALIADNVFALVGKELSVATSWLGIIAYTLQIYFDFSAYSDMAIGMGKMFGFHFLENFNYPYVAKSITDFWRRWHMSLSTWFRDYVYIPLGGNRVKQSRWVLNLFVVWFLTGLWHGANWTFIVWGLYYFVLLLVEKLTGFTRKLGVFSHVYTLLMVLIGWVFFRSESLAMAWQYLKTMFGVGAYAFSDEIFQHYFSHGVWVLLAALIFSLPILPALKRKFLPHEEQGAALAGVPAKAWMPVWAAELCRSAATCILFVLSLLVCIQSTYNPFIYFNF